MGLTFLVFRRALRANKAQGIAPNGCYELRGSVALCESFFCYYCGDNRGSSMTSLPLAAWRDFYVMIGTAAGVIVGATFVVASLATGMKGRGRKRTFIRARTLARWMAASRAAMTSLG